MSTYCDDLTMNDSSFSDWLWPHDSRVGPNSSFWPKMGHRHSNGQSPKWHNSLNAEILSAKRVLINYLHILHRRKSFVHKLRGIVGTNCWVWFQSLFSSFDLKKKKKRFPFFLCFTSEKELSLVFLPFLYSSVFVLSTDLPYLSDVHLLLLNNENMKRVGSKKAMSSYQIVS